MTVNGRRAASVAVRLREQRRGKRAVGDIPLARDDEQHIPVGRRRPAADRANPASASASTTRASRC